MQATPQPQLTLFDYILASGCAGWMAILTTLLGMVLSLIALILASRRWAIVLPVVLSFFPLAFGLFGTAYGLWLSKARVAQIELEEGTKVAPAEIDDARQLAMITTYMGGGGSAAILMFSLLAALVKRKPEPRAAD